MLCTAQNKVRLLQILPLMKVNTIVTVLIFFSKHWFLVNYLYQCCKNLFGKYYVSEPGGIHWGAGYICIQPSPSIAWCPTDPWLMGVFSLMNSGSVMTQGTSGTAGESEGQLADPGAVGCQLLGRSTLCNTRNFAVGFSVVLSKPPSANV